MDRGFIWFAQNNSTTDYIELSKHLAQSIKKVNKHNKVCIITNETVDYKEFDKIVVLKEDYSKEQEWKMNNEWQCYRDTIITNTPYRRLFETNNLPDVYNGLTYFRRSRQAQTFFGLCKDIMTNWPAVKNKFLVNCHDEQPTTDVVYALALKIQDPLCEKQIKYDWFNFMHNKSAVNGLTQAYNNDQYLNPIKIDNKIYSGGYRQSRVFHYHNKSLLEELNARIF